MVAVKHDKNGLQTTEVWGDKELKWNTEVIEVQGDKGIKWNNEVRTETISSLFTEHSAKVHSYRAYPVSTLSDEWRLS